jgi:hypothetical protein
VAGDQASALTRRQLFKHAGGAAALAVAPGLFLARPAVAAPRGTLTLAQMLPHVGSRFDLSLSRGQRVSVTLLEATGRTPATLGRRTVTGEVFSLVFGQTRTQVPAGTYSFQHPAVGPFQLFVSPVGRAVNGQRYEAVVNHVALA